jgi:hypothetical protein
VVGRFEKLPTTTKEKALAAVCDNEDDGELKGLLLFL